MSELSNKTVKIYLRLAIAAGFLSAVADRFGFWPEKVSVWHTMDAFLTYTQTLNPWCPAALIPALGWIATVAELLLGIALLIGYKLKWTAIASGALLLMFALSMSYTVGLKPVFDYAVFAASAAAFALARLE
ncbi:MAG: DoxX family protein [Kiritimatiellae bacterium]|nr:DoxX family protein [Kiritimatiellia bacterium]